MNTSIQTTISREDKRKQEVLVVITKKKARLALLTEKLELLRMELDSVQHEYHMRVGSLLIKDNTLDLEMIQLRNLKKLVDQGMTLDEAMQKEKDAFYTEILEREREKEEIDIERKILARKETPSKYLQKELSMLWKKLIMKFHPDLVTDPEQKKEREEIMKKINTCYKQSDYDGLLYIEKNNTIVTIHETTLFSLEKLAVDLENMIITVEKNMERMQQSEWFGWKTKMKKAKKEQSDVFADLEKKFIDDILTKTRMIRLLKEELGMFD